MQFAEFKKNVIAWGAERGIIQHGKPIGQALKTLEETTELLTAITLNNTDEIEDAVGDILVTLLMVCATTDVPVEKAMERAWNTIKDRKGYLRADGVFVKEE